MKIAVSIVLTIFAVTFCSFAQEGKVRVQRQSAKSLRAKYGAPVSEIFRIRKGVVAIVSYYKSGAISKIKIEPRSADQFYQPTSRLIDSKTAEEVLEELVPLSSRGKYIKGTFLTLSCQDCGGNQAEYEKVVIYTSQSDKDGPYYIVINFADGARKVEKVVTISREKEWRKQAKQKRR
jgi:hypothetical protein